MENKKTRNRSKAAFLLSTLVFMGGIDSIRAQEKRIILCPVNEITAGITTPLPEDWWETSRLGRLSAAQIRQVGGEPVLACLYEVFGDRVAIMRRPPENAMSCQVRPSGLSFVCAYSQTPGKTSDVDIGLQGKICQASIQNQIEWNYKGNNRWVSSNLERICKNAENSLQPGVCFQRVMHGNISHGKGSRWRWPHALKLCAGTRDSQLTIACFTAAIEDKKPWQQAIEECRVKP